MLSHGFLNPVTETMSICGLMVSIQLMGGGGGGGKEEMFYDVEHVEFWTRPGRFRALFYRALSQSQLRKTLEVASENSK